MRRIGIVLACVLLAACAAPMEDARVASAAGTSSLSAGA